MEPPKIWREKRQRYLALGISCKKCGKRSFPLSEYCPYCVTNDVEEYRLAETGKILYFTNVSMASNEMAFNAPYCLGIIELDDGIKVTGQIIDCDYKDLRNGMEVKMVFRILARDGHEGLIKYGFKFTSI